MTVTYDWAKDTTTVVSNMAVELVYPIDTSFVVITTLAAPEKGSAGIKVRDAAQALYYSVGPLTGPTVITPLGGMNYLAIEWNNVDQTFVPYCSNDGEMWELCSMPLDEMGVPMPYPTFAAPTHAGLFFEPGSDPLWQDTTVFGAPRVLPGSIFVTTGDGVFVVTQEEEVLEPIGLIPTSPPDPLTPSQEAIIHALVGAPFGDLEFDVGKSVGWLERFVDDIFVTDINRGDQRYWVVNWTKSFANTYYKFSSRNYFTEPEVYREGQVTDALAYATNYPKSLVYDDNDWVIFLDAHEGLSADNRSFPDDFLIAPYQSFMYREIARANEASLDRVVLPFFVFLRHDHIQNVSQSYTFEEGLPTEYTFTSTQSVGVPYYEPVLGLTRLFKMSALKAPDFDWSILDTPVPVVDDTVKLQIVSYAYAHWHLLDIPSDAAEVPPLDASNDDGWKQRCLMSQVLAIPGLPVGSASDPVGTWVDPDQDPEGYRGPWAPENYALKITDPVIPFPPPPIDPEVEMIRVPMYDLVFRLNVRDGVWYAAGGVGNTQLVWDEDLEEFVPYAPPAA